MVPTQAESTPIVPLTDLRAMTVDLTDELDAAWKEITRRSAFIGGGAVERFEQAWARYCRMPHAVGVANGTDALELTLRAVGIGPGDEVVVPTNTFVATAEAVVLAGAVPRFADVDPDTLLLTPATISTAVTDRTAAVIAVDLYGNIPDMAAITHVAETRGLALIEDAAQAHGSSWRGRMAGSFGVAACFSFYPSKNLGAFGDAGAVVTNDENLAARVRSMANHGRVGGASHLHRYAGRNSRLDGIQAAVLSVKLSMLDRWNDARRLAVSMYRQGLPDGLSLVSGSAEADPIHHQAVVRVHARDRVRDHLHRRGIGTGIHYAVPCHRQPAFRHLGSQGLPVAESAAEEILSLPLFPHITHEQIGLVTDALAEVMSKVGAGAG
jgi:dTDP-4-amino-4,6-dideoxygalactose transaminase